ncbi:inward rectifier potassium channel 2-like isoform 3 [Planoprotostelium fungivorum]|uniref:Inward rectifier potassium channel 2-like isoform 3 n=1 Tax=Planoprotostelium fungivorum TaxID=1890364 RepID=A0A2P6NII0_9EUKA|nr:inward rectifier potassium channel 2-like isoform 3 [Planoprotostelium fungivorum]
MRSHHAVKGSRPIRLVSRKGFRRFNISQYGIPINSTLDWEGINGIDSTQSNVHKLYLCICFSVQTLSTVGFGTPLAPLTFYALTLVIIETYFSILFVAVLTAFIVTKLQRPTRISRNVVFSEIAVINQVSSTFVDDMKVPITRGYFDVGQFPCLILRCANTRRPLLINSSAKLLLLRKETMDGRSLPQALKDHGGQLPDNFRFVLRMHELPFELFQQLGRPRNLNYSTPQLPLPWTFTHTINPQSPLWGTTQADLTDPNNLFEIILVIDGVDEAVSMSVQARYSYLPSDIRWNSYYVPMVKANYKTGVYEVDYSKLSSYVELDKVQVDSNMNAILPERPDLIERPSIDMSKLKPLY